VEIATLIAGTLEGSLMLSHLKRKDERLDGACRHIEEYLETHIRAVKSNVRAEKSSVLTNRPSSLARGRRRTASQSRRQLGLKGRCLLTDAPSSRAQPDPNTRIPWGRSMAEFFVTLQTLPWELRLLSTLAPEESRTTAELKINFFRG
jgi:hypothetical protein